MVRTNEILITNLKSSNISEQRGHFLIRGSYPQSSQLQVPDQDLDVWPNSSACVPDALRRYYYQYLSSTAEAAEVLLTSIKLVFLFFLSNM